MNDTLDGAAENQLARYASAVRAAFADLPGPERELLLEDLEDHLQEVAAEAGGSLAERLGRPEDYAAELRASAGLPASEARRRGAESWLQATWGAQQLGRLWRATSTHPSGRSVLDFLPELRPAWWVLRGYLAVQWASVGLSYLLAGNGLSFPIPELFGTQLLGLAAVAAAVPVSVALGRRRTTRRGLALLANTALALFALFLLTDLNSSRYAAEAYWDQTQYEGTYPGPNLGLRSDGGEISNIFPFDADGRPLHDIYLVDQDGRPVVATHNDSPELKPILPLDRDGNEVGHRYPQRQLRVDASTGQRVPVTPPAFRSPPGPLRPPPDPGPPTTDPPPGP